MQSSLILSIQFGLCFCFTTWNLSEKCWRWNLKEYIFRGLIKAGLCRTLLHIKIRQKLKSTNAQTELLGRSSFTQTLNVHSLFFWCLDASLGSLETVQVTLCGLGPINFLVRRLVKDLVVQNIRWQPGKIFYSSVGLLIIYLEIVCPLLKLISPGTLPQSDADNFCYFGIIFCWLMMMKFSGDYSSLRPGKSSKMPSTTSRCLIIFHTLRSAQRQPRTYLRIRRWLCDSFSLSFFISIASL